MKDDLWLDSCPFCGGEASIIKWEVDGYVFEYGVKCKLCDVIVADEDTAKNAVEKWNRRV